MNFDEHFDVLDAAYRLGGDTAMLQVAATIGYPHYAAIERLMERVRNACRDVPAEIERAMNAYYTQFLGVQLPRTNTQRDSLCAILQQAAEHVLKSFEDEKLIAVRKVEASDDFIRHHVVVRATFNLLHAPDPASIYCIQLSVRA